MMSVVEERVKAGASYLDGVKPGWRDSINVDALDLSDGEKCILGQLYDDYGSALDQLGLSTDQARRHGFESDHYVSNISSGMLTDAWEKLLASGSYVPDSVWVNKLGELRRIVSTVRQGDETVITYELSDSSTEFIGAGYYGATTTAHADSSGWKKFEPFPYAKGDILMGKSGRRYLVESESKVWALDYSSAMHNTYRVRATEDGPLVEMKSAMGRKMSDILKG
jgi:hypothetical protein